MAVVMGVVVVVGIGVLGAVGTAGYVAYTRLNPSKDGPRPDAVPPQAGGVPRDEDGNPTTDTPLTRPARAATVGVWAPGPHPYHFGSCFVAGPPGHVVTTARLIGHGPGGPRPQSIQVTVGVGQKQWTTPARVVRVDAAADLALLRVDDPGLPPPVALVRTRPPLDGQVVRVFGYTKPTDLRGGAVITDVRVARVVVSGLDVWTVELVPDHRLKVGHTGGPVVSLDGTVVGMCSVGPGPGEVKVTPVDQILRFLDAK